MSMIKTMTRALAAATLTLPFLTALATAQPNVARPWQDPGWRRGGWESDPGRWGAGYFGEYPYPGYRGYFGCWRAERVLTPAGPRWHREWTCY